MSAEQPTLLDQLRAAGDAAATLADHYENTALGTVPYLTGGEMALVHRTLARLCELLAEHEVRLAAAAEANRVADVAAALAPPAPPPPPAPQE